MVKSNTAQTTVDDYETSNTALLAVITDKDMEEEMKTIKSQGGKVEEPCKFNISGGGDIEQPVKTAL